MIYRLSIYKYINFTSTSEDFRRGTKMEYEEDIYEKEMIDRMLDEDELADWEAGMMLGYDEDFEE